jgi:PLP dependent protein
LSSWNVPPPETSLRGRLTRIKERIRSICEQSGRPVEAVTIVAVSKTFPAEEIRKAYALGLYQIGENRVQEIIDKFGDGTLQRDCPKLSLHLVGHLQTNKVRKAVQYVSAVDSVDSFRLAEAINQEAAQVGRTIRILLEVNTSDEPQKFGLDPEAVRPSVETILNLKSLALAGLMTVGPNVDDPQVVRRSFIVLRELFDHIRSTFDPPHWSVLSMGMSGDFELAVEEGATEIRLGTALFGERSTL